MRGCQRQSDLRVECECEPDADHAAEQYQCFSDDVEFDFGWGHETVPQGKTRGSKAQVNCTLSEKVIFKHEVVKWIKQINSPLPLSHTS